MEQERPHCHLWSFSQCEPHWCFYSCWNDNQCHFNRSIQKYLKWEFKFIEILKHFGGISARPLHLGYRAVDKSCLTVVNHHAGTMWFGLYRQWSSYSVFGAQDEQLQRSPPMEIINFKKEAKLHFEFPVLCQNNLHSTEQRNSNCFI